MDDPEEIMLALGMVAEHVHIDGVDVCHKVMRVYAAWGLHLPGNHAGLRFEEPERIATETIRSGANPSPRRVP